MPVGIGGVPKPFEAQRLPRQHLPTAASVTSYLRTPLRPVLFAHGSEFITITEPKKMMAIPHYRLEKFDRSPMTGLICGGSNMKTSGADMHLRAVDA